MHQYGYLEVVVLPQLTQLLLLQHKLKHLRQLPLAKQRHVLLDIVLGIQPSVDLHLIVPNELLDALLDDGLEVREYTRFDL